MKRNLLILFLVFSSIKCKKPHEEAQKKPKIMSQEQNLPPKAPNLQDILRSYNEDDYQESTNNSVERNTKSNHDPYLTPFNEKRCLEVKENWKWVQGMCKRKNFYDYCLQENTKYDKILNLLKTSPDCLESFIKLKKIQTLDLSSHNLTSIHPLIGAESLKDVNLSNNLLTDISPLLEIKTLRNLDLSYNKISDIRPILNLNLNMLNLSFNPLNSLYELNSITSLTELFLNSTTIVDLEALTSLKKIKTLALNFHSIRELDFLKNFPVITRVYLNTNQIKYVEKLPETITNIDLSNNKIRRLDLTDMKSLLQLNLAQNQINSLENLAGDLDSLKDLNLSGNNLKNIYSFSKFKNLEVLNLSNNPISEVNFLGLEMLKDLYLQNCKLKSYTSLTFLAVSIRKVDLRFCEKDVNWQEIFPRRYNFLDLKP